MTKTPEAYDAFRRGHELLEMREYPQAVIALERARTLEPDKSSVREALGRAYLSIKSYRRASEEFEAAIALDPTDGYAHYGLAHALERLGDPRAALHRRLASVYRTGLGEDGLREVQGPQ